MGDRDVKSRMKLTICAQATGSIGGLEHQYLLSASCEVGRTDQPGVSCADNDRVVLVQRHTPLFELFFLLAKLDSAPL